MIPRRSSNRITYKRRTPYVKKAIAIKRRTVTKSLLKRKFKNERVKVEGAGGQISRFNHTIRPTKFISNIMRLASKNFYNTNGAFRLNCGTGVQTYTAYGYFTAGTFGGTTVDNDLAVINAKVTSSLGTYKTARILVESATARYMMTNQDTGNVQVYIYDVVARLDTNISPDVAFQTGIADEGAAAATTVGATPFASEQFTTHFKILKCTTVILGQGQTHSHLVHYAPNRMFSSERLTDNNKSLRGLTCYSLIVAHGLPMNDSVTNTNVSTGAVNLDIVMTKQLKYSFVMDDTTNYYVTNNLVAITNEEVMNIAQGIKTLDIPA